MDAVTPFDAESIARHAEAVRRLARRLVWDPHRAEDVAQEAFVAALEQQPSPRKGLGPWLRGVTRHLAANVQRKERRLAARHARSAAPAPVPAPEEVVERLRAQRLVADALASLGEPYRQTLYLRYFEDLPPRAIAARLDLPVNTVRTHLRRGRERLKQEIAARSDARRPWQAALLPLLAPRVPTPAPVTALAAAAPGLGGTLLMFATSRYAIALLVLLLLGGGVTALSLDDAADDATPTIETGAVAPLPTLERTAPQEPVGGTPAPAPAPPPEPAAPNAIAMRLEGRVLDPRGQPLAGVPVRLHASHDAGPGVDPTVPLAAAESDAQGRFELRLEAGIAGHAASGADPWLRAVVAAVHPRWLFACLSLAVSTGGADGETLVRRDLELRFEEPFQVRCRVVDEAGRPIAGAVCRWGSNSALTPRPDGRYYEGRTDAEGRAQLEIPVVGAEPASILLRTAGVRAVHAEAPGYARGMSDLIRIIQPTPGQVIETEITLGAGHGLAGRVVDDRGEGVADLPLSVWLQRPGAALAWDRQVGNAVRTDAEGRFLLEGVPTGSWTMQVSADGYADGTLDLEVPSRDVTVQLVPQTTIVVQYERPDGTRVLPTIYHAVREGDPPFSRYGGRRKPGPLEIDDLRPGRYRMSVQLIGRGQPFVHALELTAGPNAAQTFVVPPLEGAVVEGRLLDASGEPLAGRVLLEPQGGDPDDTPAVLDHPVDEHGIFRFEGVTPGRYLLRGGAADHAPTARTLEVPTAEPGPVDLRLGRGVTLRVRLPRRPPEATWRWQLQLRTAHGATIEVTAPEPDEDGWLEFARLPVGTTTVLLESTSFRAELVPNDPYVALLDGAEGEVVQHAFPRKPGATVRGRVFDAAGKPRQQYMVSLQRVASDFEPPAGMPHAGYSWKTVFTDDEGRFVAPALPPGRYVVLSVRQAGVPLVLDVTEAEEQRVELRAR